MVPFAAPTRLEADERAAVEAAVRRVVASEVWAGGPEVTGFETGFADYLGAPDAGREVVGVGNGTDALAIAFGALGLRAGDGVLVADGEGGYAAIAAAQLGLRVQVMDLDGPPRSAVGLSAVVATHLHGDLAAGFDRLDDWRRDHGLLLVEDCAQAHGLRVGGRHVGLRADAATFSFYPTKNLGAIGDGGAIVLAPEAARRARSLREYGWRERYRVEHPGGRNSRLDPVQAAVLSARLPFLDRRNEARRAIAARYRAQVQVAGDPERTVAHHAVAVLPDRAARDRLAAACARAGVGTAHHYPHLVSEMPGLEVTGAPTPLAADLRDRSLSLPCFSEMTDDETEQVLAVLAVLARLDEAQA